MSDRESPASYTNPRGAPAGEEKVIKVDGTTVVTLHKGTRTTYHGVKDPRVAEGDMLRYGSLEHRTRSIVVAAWSPFDGTDDDD
jgi:hypothetical protein